MTNRDDFKLRIGPYELMHSTKYGIDLHTGWSASVRGSVVCQFRPLPVAIWTLLRYCKLRSLI